MNLPQAKMERSTALKLWQDTKSEYAKEQVILANYPMVIVILNKLNLNSFDEDLQTIGIMGLLKAVNTFDFGREVVFATYATPIIKNEILQTFRRKRLDVVSLNEEISCRNGETQSYSNILPCDFCLEDEVIENELVKGIIPKLKPREKEIVRLFFYEDKSQSEISRIIGLSQSYISRVLKGLEKYGKECA